MDSTIVREHGVYRLRAETWNDGGTHYLLTRPCGRHGQTVVLAFSITARGYLVCDGRDLYTAARAWRLTKNWA